MCQDKTRGGAKGGHLPQQGGVGHMPQHLPRRAPLIPPAPKSTRSPLRYELLTCRTPLFYIGANSGITGTMRQNRTKTAENLFFTEILKCSEHSTVHSKKSLRKERAVFTMPQLNLIGNGSITTAEISQNLL